MQQEAIRINAVVPGIIHTSMLDKMMATQGRRPQRDVKDVSNRPAWRPEEIASAESLALQLRREFHGWYALAVDGGYTIR